MDPHDKDWITLSTDQELVEALSLVNFEPPVLHMELFMTHSQSESEIRADDIVDMSHFDKCCHMQDENAARLPEQCHPQLAGIRPEIPENCGSQAGAFPEVLDKCRNDMESERIDSDEQGEGGPSDTGSDFYMEEKSLTRTSRALDSVGDSGQGSVPPVSQYEHVVVVDDSARHTDEALARLVDMGFDNTAQLEVLLRLHDGDVDAVLEALLSD
jgi:hypothetical protein